MTTLPHGYTNRTVADGALVRKAYGGPDVGRRREREFSLLTTLQRQLPVPPVAGRDGDVLVLGFVPGVPGQELMDGGHAAAVLWACGALLRRIHQEGTRAVGFGTNDAGAVLVHGDYGPNNVLIDPTAFRVTAVVDWEFAHVGDAVEDLAWCERIVRMHHPGQVEALDHLFGGYGAPVPGWRDRRATMLARCAWLEDFCRRRAPDDPGVPLWRTRAALTATWEA